MVAGSYRKLNESDVYFYPDFINAEKHILKPVAA